MEEKILNRWLKGELSDEELKDFSSSKKYALYRKIMEVSEGFEQPIFEKKQTFKSIENQILMKKEEKSSKVINWSWMYAAASIFLILGMVYFLYPNIREPLYKYTVSCEYFVMSFFNRKKHFYLRKVFAPPICK